MTRVVWILALLFIYGNAQSQEFRKYANSFLYHGIDARGRALGNAILTSSEDVFSGYWNPAGLADVDASQTQVGYMHVFDGLYNYDVAGVAFPTKRKGETLALNAVRYGIDDIPNTIFLVDESGNINPNNITGFSAADYGGYLSYSKPLNSQLNLGASAKVIHRNVGDFAKAWGAGVDVGLKYKHINNKFKAALFAKDLFGTYTSWDFNFDDPEIRQVFENTGNEIPADGTIEANTPNVVLGGSYLFDLNRLTILSEVNLDLTFDGQRNTLVSSEALSIDPHMGVEFGYDRTIFLRAGINNIQQATNIDSFNDEWSLQPSAGAGVKQKRFEIDYALTQYDFREELTHLVTVKFGISKPEYYKE